MRYYFTFGLDDKFPFKGGWVIIDAQDKQEACDLFSVYYPKTKDGLLCCASVYDERAFMATGMHEHGNFNKWCHVEISAVKSDSTDPNKTAFKTLFSQYCKKKIREGECDEYKCETCPINIAYDMIFE